MRATLIRMGTGEMVEISTRTRSWAGIRNCASLLGVDFPGRKYTVSLDRVAGVCKVTRIS